MSNHLRFYLCSVTGHKNSPDAFAPKSIIAGIIDGTHAIRGPIPVSIDWTRGQPCVYQESRGMP